MANVMTTLNEFELRNLKERIGDKTIYAYVRDLIINDLGISEDAQVNDILERLKDVKTFKTSQASTLIGYKVAKSTLDKSLYMEFEKKGDTWYRHSNH